jgi:uncharacterized repeat protein (TIGR01451 family)
MEETMLRETQVAAPQAASRSIAWLIVMGIVFCALAVLALTLAVPSSAGQVSGSASAQALELTTSKEARPARVVGVGEAAPLSVDQAVLVLDKVASPTRVISGQPVTYAITLANNGEMTGTVDLVTDTLDAELTYAGVVPGGDLGAPLQSPVGTLVWEGPIEIPPHSALSQSYRVDTPAGTDFFQACNHLEVSTLDGAPAPVAACVDVGPERAYLYFPVMTQHFRYAYLEVEKSVSPQAIPAGTDSEVVYAVSIVNVGDTTGTLLTIEDTLPAGLTYVGMAPGSEVTANPSGTTGTIAWHGSWPMPPGERLDVLYRVRANVPAGQVANEVVVVAREADVPDEPAVAILQAEVSIAGLVAGNDGPTFLGSPTLLSASVTAGSNVVYTWAFGDGTTGSGSSVSHVYPAVGSYVATVTARNLVSQVAATTTVTIKPAVWLEENFNDAGVGISRWTKFLNYWRLEEGQWYWGAADGVGGTGAATQDCYLGGTKMAEDALLMYLGPGAEDWTDYRVETKLLLRGGADETDDGTIYWIEEGGSPIGLWVRGQYTAVDDRGGGWVTGYYVNAGGNPYKSTMYVRLSQLQTLTDCWDAACDNPQNLYDFNNPHTILEVTLERTFARRTWYTLAVEVRGNNIKIFFENELVIEWDDPKEPFLTGTVGFKTYKSETASFDNLIVTPLN